MKKDLIFAPALILIGVALWLLQLTGIVAHIVISIVGILVLVAYTVLTKKEWKIPALEIAARACYGIALITGIVVMNVSGLAALAVIHKVCATLFVVGILASLVQKLACAKKA